MASDTVTAVCCKCESLGWWKPLIISTCTEVKAMGCKTDYKWKTMVGEELLYVILNATILYLYIL